MDTRRLDRAGIGLYLLWIALPIGLGLGYALLYSLGLTGLMSDGFTLAHWKAVLGGSVFWSSLAFSVWVAACSMLVAGGGALMTVMARREDLKTGRLPYLYYVPLTLPAMVVAFYAFQLLSRGGLLSRLAYRAGLVRGMESFPDLVNDGYGVGIVFAHVFMAFPFFCLLFGSLYRSERLDTYAELASSLGAGPKELKRRVLVPVLLRRAFPTLLLYFIFMLSSYEIPLLLGSRSREMISVLTIQKLQRFNLLDIPQAYVISVLYSVIVMAMLLLFLAPRLPGRRFPGNKSSEA